MTIPLYDRIGIGYAERRRPDARVAARITSALGACHTVLNVGAGTGSYEPADGFVVAVEPSAEMVRQRPRTAARAVRASADHLPFQDQSFDAALALLTIHHWPDRKAGLAEMRRVTRDRVVIFTWDPQHAGFWLVQDYLPEILAMDRPAFPSLHEIEQAIGPVEVHEVSVPADCIDGFLGAYWRRPAEYLDPRARSAISVFSKVDATAGLARLEQDLGDGTWSTRYGSLMSRAELDIGYRLVVARCA